LLRVVGGGYDPRVRQSSSWIAALFVAAAFLIAPAASQATLVFTRNPLHPVVFAANDNGSGAHRIGSGSNPRVSPDGQTVAFYRLGDGSRSSELLVAPTAGGPVRKLASGWQDPFVFAWSPDSTRIAVLLGPEIGAQRLTAIDVATGEQDTIAGGYFTGVSFSPRGDELVYSQAGSESFPSRSDIFRIELLPPGAVDVRAVQPQRLTNDHRSSSPLWGPHGTIVFVKNLGEKRRKYGPKSDLFLMSSNGNRVRRLTHTKVAPLLFGLSPTEWSASGKQLLAEFGGQDTSYAVTVNPKTGAERALTRRREVGFVGTAISRDGKLVLGSLGGFEPGPGHKVVSIPYVGGRPRVLVKNASEPDWNR
jgi:Tol biopolymer transport system component